MRPKSDWPVSIPHKLQHQAAVLQRHLVDWPQELLQLTLSIYALRNYKTANSGQSSYSEATSEDEQNSRNP
jgi:hypothetical protein